MKLSYIRNIAFGSLLLIAPFLSCKKTIETSPYSQFTTANFFSTVEEAKMATLGVYEILKTRETYGWYIPLVYDTDTDVSFLTAGTTNNEFREIAHYYYMPGHPYLYNSWSTIYNGIDRANLVIERIPQMALFSSGTESQKAELNRFVGEALFLRGFYYSELIRLWGDVPFKTKSSVSGADLNTPLTDRHEIYTQIIKDIQQAVEYLPSTISTDERVNRYAAQAILARIALAAGGYSLRADGNMQRPENYKEYYQLALRQVDDVIGSGLYELNPIYSEVFKNQSMQVFEPKENLFEASIYTPTITSSNNSSFGTFNSPLTTNGLYGNTLNRTFVPVTFYNSFEDGDLRRDFSIARYSLDAEGKRIAARNDGVWTPAKWSREYQGNNSLERLYTNINCVIMRYADVLLMKAEIENELNGGPNIAAYEAINTVRRRAFGMNAGGSSINITINAANGGTGYESGSTFVNISGGGGRDASALVTVGTGANAGKITAIRMLNAGSGYTSLPTVTFTGTGQGATPVVSMVPKKTAQQVDLSAGLDKEAFLSRIQNERAFELCFEGSRRQDLIRWNLLGDKIEKTFTDVKAIRANYPYVNNFVKGKHELYPFPQNEKDANPAITRQNPGF